jgi:hypothetical protein
MTPFEIATLVMSVLGLILTGFSVVMWTMLQQTRAAADRANDSLASFKLDVAQQHPTHSHVERIVAGLSGQMSEVNAKIDGLVTSIHAMGEGFRDRLEKKADR